MPESGYQPPEGYLTLGQSQERLRVSRPTLTKLIRAAGLELYEDPRDSRVKLLRVEDVDRLAQPVKRAA